MTATITAYPQGLLSILQTQNFGQNPKVLGDVVSPTIDLRDLYLIQVQGGTSGAVAVPANGFNIALTVPSNEIWRVVAGGLIVTHGAGVTGDYTPVIQARGSQVPIGPTVSVGANQVRWPVMTSEPLWMEPGTILGASIGALVGAPSVQASYLVQRLRS